MSLQGCRFENRRATEIPLAFFRIHTLLSWHYCCTLPPPQMCDDFNDLMYVYLANNRSNSILCIIVHQRRKDTEAGFRVENLAYCTLDMFEAGTETVTSTLRWALLNMIKYPVIQGTTITVQRGHTPTSSQCSYIDLNPNALQLAQGHFSHDESIRIHICPNGESGI